MAEHNFRDHIMLLPSQDYWEWVGAAQAYVAAFDVNLTPDPDSAGHHKYPGQTITVAAPTDGYPEHAPIEAWFQSHYPQAELDLIEAADPAALRATLDARIQQGDPLGGYRSRAQIAQRDWFAAAPIQLHWPAETGHITQAFGVHPEMYAALGLPGHEGVDIRAPLNSRVGACADGEVYAVHAEADDGHPYGRHLGILHAHGYRTIYAHLGRVLVKQGQKVKAGEPVGLADATGHSAGAHLHLTLKRDGATAGGYSQFPDDVIDPTPFLLFPNKTRSAADFPWPPAHCLAGLNTPPDGVFTDVDLEIIHQAGMEALKLSPKAGQAQIGRLMQLDPAPFLMTGLYLTLGNQSLDPAQWAARLRPQMQLHYAAGVRYFELQRAPNLQSEGCFSAWGSGAEFARWWLDAAALLKADFPEAQLGFPGLSPGGRVDGLRLDAGAFLEGAEAALQAADWLGVQCYWTTETEMEQDDKGAFYRPMRALFPDKLLFITEFGDLNALADPAVIGREVARFYSDIRQQAGVGAAFAQILASSGPYASLAWRSPEGAISSLVAEVSRRGD